MIDVQQQARRLPGLIVLTGFRATGKTAVGSTLAARLNYRFMDTDAEVVKRLGCTIAESVQQGGWQRFREVEQQVLADCCRLQETVLATGGGAVCHADQWQELRRQAFVVWLRSNPATIRKRLLADSKTAGQRPALGGGDVAAEIEQLLAEREPLYRNGSDTVLDTSSFTPAELAEQIEQLLAAR